MEEPRAVLQLRPEELSHIDTFRREKHTAVLVIMFTDVEGSSPRVDMLERAAFDVFPALHRKFAEIVERDGGGSFIKDEGDATMAIFSEPSTAVERALEIQRYLFDRNRQRPGEPPVLIRCGLHMGQVVIADQMAPDALGSNVAIAWRVQSLAEGGHIYMTEAVFRDARRFLRRVPGLRWESYGRYRLAGFEEPEAICEVAVSDLAPPKPPQSVSRVRSVRYVLGELALPWVWGIAVALVAVALVGSWLYFTGPAVESKSVVPAVPTPFPDQQPQPPERRGIVAPGPPDSKVEGGEKLVQATATGFSAPGRRTQGITWDGTYLWLSDNSGEIFKVDPNSRTVVRAYPAPEVTPEGLAWDGSAFWVFTTNYSFIYRFSMDDSGNVPKTRTIVAFRSPNRTIGGTNDGLAWDGTHLWYADQHTVYKIDTGGNVLSSFAFPQEVAGLAWDGEKLWIAHNSFPDSATFTTTDTKGKVLSSFRSPVLRIDALTWGDGHLWAAGADKLGGGSMIYKIELHTKVIGAR